MAIKNVYFNRIQPFCRRGLDRTSKPRSTHSHRTGREGGLGLGNELIWYQGEVPALHHTLREISHDGVRLAMQVPEHFIGAPTAKETNHIGVHFGAQ